MSSRVSSVVKISWSGGKDSTADILLNHFDGNKCKIVCYIPMLTAKIPLIRKSHYEHILRCSETFKSWGHDVYIVTGVNYCQHFNKIKTRGKYKGSHSGYNLGLGFCKFRDCSKVKTLKETNVGYYDYESIGIAVDEINRHSQLNSSLRSTLCEHNFTEEMAMNLCKAWHMLSPQYETSGRDGCCICPNSKDSEYFGYLSDYPHAKTILKILDNRYNHWLKTENIKPDKPFRGNLNFTERMALLNIY